MIYVRLKLFGKLSEALAGHSSFRSPPLLNLRWWVTCWQNPGSKDRECCVYTVIPRLGVLGYTNEMWRIQGLGTWPRTFFSHGWVQSRLVKWPSLCVVICACQCLSISVFVWAGTCNFLPSCPLPLFTSSSITSCTSNPFWTLFLASLQCQGFRRPPSCYCFTSLSIFSYSSISPGIWQTWRSCYIELNLETLRSKRDEKDTQSWCASTFFWSAFIYMCMPLTASSAISCWDFLPFWLHSSPKQGILYLGPVFSSYSWAR